MTDRRRDFAERPLIAGTFTGIRSWRVGVGGILTGVHVTEPWQSGENEAQCTGGMLATLRAFSDAVNRMALSSAQWSWAMGAMTAALNGRVHLVKRPKTQPIPEPEPHRVAGLDCQCGFYAYFDLDANPHHLPGNVLGLIEGYGTMTIGQRGFRASKARIVALIEPVPPTVRGVYATLPPIFSTIDAALAEFPLSTPPPPEPTRRERRARDIPQPQDPRSARDRALQARRERNTGPADPHRLDRRRRA